MVPLRRNRSRGSPDRCRIICVQVFKKPDTRDCGMQHSAGDLRHALDFDSLLCRAHSAHRERRLTGVSSGEYGHRCVGAVDAIFSQSTVFPNSCYTCRSVDYLSVGIRRIIFYCAEKFSETSSNRFAKEWFSRIRGIGHEFYGGMAISARGIPG